MTYRTIPTILICLSPGLFGLAVNASADDKKHEHHEAHAGHMLQSYEKIATALFKDDLAAAKKEAAKMADHDEESACAKHATAIAGSKTIEEARGHFKGLSGAAIELAKHHADGKFTVMHCPMVKGGGADWLQSNAEKVANPYFGSKMPNCGGPKKPES